jgi:hypothetical protein
LEMISTMNPPRFVGLAVPGIRVILICSEPYTAIAGSAIHNR